MDSLNRLKFSFSAILWLCIFASVFSPTAKAADPPEYQIKALFILNFTKFISWPQTAFDSAAAPLPICILGDDPFGNVMDQVVENESVGGHKVTVERFRRGPVPKLCRVLFISKSEKDVPALIGGLGAGVLTVSDRDSFINEGGMIDLVVEDRRVRFDINNGAAVKASLMLSARLLNVARYVLK